LLRIPSRPRRQPAPWFAHALIERPRKARPVAVGERVPSERDLARDALAVDRERERAPDAHVIERRVRKVKGDAGDQRGRRVGVAQAGRAHEQLGLLQRRDQVEIQLARLQERQIGPGVGNDAHVDPVDRRNAAPIARVGRIFEPVAALPRHETERSVSDARRRIERRAIERRLRGEHVFGQHVLRARPVRKQRRDRRRPRVPQMKLNDVGTERSRVVDQVVALARAHRIARIQDRTQREQHVARRKGHAVAPAHVRAQMIR